jgi:hypothetical protein
MLRHVFVVAAAALLVGCGPDGIGDGHVERTRESIELDRAETVRTELSLGAGELRVAGGAAKLMEGDFDYYAPSWKPEIQYRSTGVRGDLTIRQASRSFPGGALVWDLRLNDNVAMDLSARLGAGEARLNLGTLNLRDLEVKMGAGELHLDLRGNPKRSYSVRIQGGVGQANVSLPKNVGITATANGGIGEIHVRGLEKHGGVWINPELERSGVNIRVDVKGGVGEINLIAE